MRVATLSTVEGKVVCSRCLIAQRPWQRMRGLLGRADLQPGEGMLFRPAGSIHMFFMRFSIDAIFCTADLDVIDVERNLRPWRVAGRRGAKVVIELAAGVAEAVAPGDRLVLDQADRRLLELAGHVGEEIGDLRPKHDQGDDHDNRDE